MSSKREERRLIAQELEIVSVETWQEKPYTAVKVKAKYELAAGMKRKIQRYEAVGFAKVSWPDDWDPDYGETLAEAKAVAKICKRIQNDLAEM